MVTTRKPRTRPAKPWKAKFIAAFAKTGIVLDGTQAAGISRKTAYKERKLDELFADAWDKAYESAMDVLEREAVRRAVEGIEKGVYHAGKLIDTERRYSDTLLMFMLNGGRAHKYRQRAELIHKDGGQTGEARAQAFRKAMADPKLAAMMQKVAEAVEAAED